MSSDGKIIFFLGAGASIPAGINGVVGLVDDYKKNLKTISESDFNIIDKITAMLSEWIAEQKLDRQVDIELVLETIERLENKEKDIILKFYDNGRFIFDDLKADHHLS